MNLARAILEQLCTEPDRTVLSGIAPRSAGDATAARDSGRTANPDVGLQPGKAAGESSAAAAADTNKQADVAHAHPHAALDGAISLAYSLNRRALLHRTAAWSQSFAAAGLAPGAKVVLSPGRGPNLAALHLAALASGLAVVPLNSALTPKEVASLLDEADVDLVVSSAAVAVANFDTAARIAAPWWVEDAASCRAQPPFAAPPRLGSAELVGAIETATAIDTATDSPTRATSPTHATIEAREPAPTAVGARAAHTAGSDPARARAAGSDPAGDPAGDVDWPPRVFPAVAVERDDEDTALILYTSGTTGRPKSVELSHGNLRANLEALAAVWSRSPQDRLLHILPAHHYHGLVLALYGSLLAGGEIVIMRAFDARAVLDAVPALGINLLMGVPTMYARMLEAARDGDCLAGLRLALCGSAPLPAKTWQAFKDRFGIALVERYGLTETGIICSNPPDAPRPGSVGFAAPGTTLSIRSEAGEYHQRPNERGEICIAGPSVMRGYGNDAEATRASIHDGRFHSGDLGYFDDDGYLYIDGRAKDLIIVGGSNVIPAEVERALAAVPGVREVVAAASPHPDLGEVVAAYIVAEEAPAGTAAAAVPGANSEPHEPALRGDPQGRRPDTPGSLWHHDDPESGLRVYMRVKETPRPQPQEPAALSENAQSQAQEPAALPEKPQPDTQDPARLSEAARGQGQSRPESTGLSEPGTRVTTETPETAEVAAAEAALPLTQSRAALEAALRTAAEAGLARYKRPRAYFFVEEIPRNAMGKVDRAKLVELGRRLSGTV